MTFEECVAACAVKTGMSREDWQDFLQLPPAAQAATAQTYADQAWVQNPHVLADVIAVLIVAGQVAGAVSGISGAVTALQALRV